MKPEIQTCINLILNPVKLSDVRYAPYNILIPIGPKVVSFWDYLN